MYSLTRMMKEKMMKATQTSVLLMQSWAATVSKLISSSSGSDSEDQLEEGNL